MCKCNIILPAVVLLILLFYKKMWSGLINIWSRWQVFLLNYIIYLYIIDIIPTYEPLHVVVIVCASHFLAAHSIGCVIALHFKFCT